MTAIPDARDIDNRSNQNGVVFVGSKSIGLRALHALVEILPAEVSGVITLDDQAADRSAFLEFERFCSDHTIPLHVLSHHSSLDQALTQASPSLIVVVGWYWLIPEQALQSAPRGAVAVHASLLPDLRGSAPLVWAILTGRKRTGVSLFYLDRHIDAGDVIDQISFDIPPHATIADLLLSAETACVQLIQAHAAGLLDGTAPRRQQEPSNATYGGIRRPADGRLDWRLPADALYDAVRAQTKPYPGAFAHFDAHILRVWRASVFPKPLYGVPGVVCQMIDERPVVATRHGALVLEDYELESASRENSKRLWIGDRLE